jgi:Bacteriocin-protection, YdeI or OmpD-Associated/Domain of unknown function (DUF1905)
MAMKAWLEQRFRATIEGEEKSRVFIVLPFDAAEVWGEREPYHVTGSLGHGSFRGVIEKVGNRFILPLGPAFRRDRGLKPGDEIELRLGLEGPHRHEQAPDIVAALDAEPEAAAFFDSIAQFYRKGYLRWIDATKRSPEVRARRIAETVRRLKNGNKHPPR